MVSKKLRIGMLASNFIRIPPEKKYLTKGNHGAAEMVVHRITEGLVERGHDVTLFASGDSKTKAKLCSVTEKSSLLDKKIGEKNHRFYEHLLISKAYQMAQKGKFDIIHTHLDIRSAHYAPLVKTPTVSTIHSPLTSYKMRYILGHYKKSQHYISISNAQRKGMPDLNYASTIYHGIDTNKIQPEFSTGDYLLYAGAITLQKGVLEALKIAKKAGEKIIVSGAKSDEKYWKKIEPYIDNKNAKLLGLLERSEYLKLMRNAKAFLFPIQWEEPFGLVLIESMACGTPVIGFRRGSVPEIVKDGKTGFIAKDINDAVGCVKRIEDIERRECRRHAENKFGIDKMIDNHVDVYRKIIGH
jgi:glycosyltransferase involved in cell wall biosynthesis